MASNSTLEDMREARDIIRGLYNAAHTLACNDPCCPWAQLSNEHSASTSAGASPREEEFLLILFGLAKNIGECLDLLRILVSDRDETSSLTHLSQSSTTTSRLSTEDTYVEPHERVDSPPRPGLYRDQWTQTPALSPPAFTAFLRDYPRGPPRAPAPSPATSGTITSDFGTSVFENREEASHVGQGEHERAGISTDQFPSHDEDP